MIKRRNEELNKWRRSARIIEMEERKKKRRNEMKWEERN
jgi:hypothetical protein